MIIIFTILATCIAAVVSLVVLRQKPSTKPATTPTSTEPSTVPVKSGLSASAPVFIPSFAVNDEIAAEMEEIDAEMDELDAEMDKLNDMSGNQSPTSSDFADFEDDDEGEVDWVEIDAGNGQMLRVPREAARLFNTTAKIASKPTLKSAPKNKSSIPCSFFLKGRCNKGATCEYLHPTK